VARLEAKLGNIIFPGAHQFVESGPASADTGTLSFALNHDNRPGMQNVGRWTQNLPVTAGLANTQPGYAENPISEPRGRYRAAWNIGRRGITPGAPQINPCFYKVLQ
jgi:hypothetical protein